MCEIRADPELLVCAQQHAERFMLIISCQPHSTSKKWVDVIYSHFTDEETKGEKYFPRVT